MMALIAVWASLSAAIEREPWAVYQSRRRALADKHGEGLILLFGYGEREAQFSRSSFRQEHNFYYLSGWNEPDAALLLLPENETGRPYREILFLPARNDSHERWSGARIGPEDPDLSHRTGFAEVRGTEALRQTVREALATHRRVYSLLPNRHPSYGQPPEPDRTGRLKELAPGVAVSDIRPALARMRLVKSESEVRLIQKAVDATIAAHRAAWETIRAGLAEYQVLAAMMGPMMQRGCLRLAYPPIVGSGSNATVLHYSLNSSKLRKGEVILLDVGGEYAHYAADITRVAPVDGTFSDRQREIYNIVLGAQEAAIQAVKPGMKLAGKGPDSLHQIARDYFNSHGKDKKGNSLGQYFIHGLGHHVGLEVHDPGDPHAPLEPGMVITVEPGLYIPEENLGVRIEDMILVTPQGGRTLSSELPRQAEEIESYMRSR